MAVVESADFVPTMHAVAFYALPSKRLCVAYSCNAGAEHTGRGGQRVYTFNVVFSAEDFARCGYNPFSIVRALHRDGLARPQLKPDNVLGVLELAVEADCGPVRSPMTAEDATSRILPALLSKKSLLVNVGHGWLDSAEGLMVSLPGPLRVAVSFSAGLRFSTGRTHRLQLLFDDNGTGKSRSAGRPVTYVDLEEPEEASRKPAPGQVDAPNWLEMVNRHWERRKFADLAERTSRPFADVSPEGLERIAHLYIELDELAHKTPRQLVETAVHCLEATADAGQAEMRAQLVPKAQSELCKRLPVFPWPEVKSHWPVLIELWRGSTAESQFAEPLLAAVLHRGMQVEPVEAAVTALDLTHDRPDAANVEVVDALIEKVLQKLLTRLAAATQVMSQADPGPTAVGVPTVDDLLRRWKSARPSDPNVDQLFVQFEQLKSAMQLRPAP